MIKYAALLLAALLSTQAAKADDVSVGPLHGTFQNANIKGATPQVLILAGSGPTDRDGNNPLGVKASSYRLLAEELSKKGIASTRVDKRGMFASAAGAVDANSVFIPQLAADAHVWVKEIRQSTGAKCVWLAGHSEGGLVALVAAQDPTDLCGLILIASPGRPAGDILREQLKANPANAPLLGDAFSVLQALESDKAADVSAMHPALQGLFSPAVQPFWRSMLKIRPAELIRAYQGPILIVQGETDLQVSMADALALKDAQPRAELAKIPNTNHVLKSAPADRSANFATYADPTLPISPAVVSVITDFIVNH
ncbi:alpha/beta hydrolase [Asticcacaulis benevestitus]|uniref:Serine aminopeptidase S33 domain-containing protein n=1 Tax=Asticcacaulis benevestitus DSM 16100 = ATCC BAA-896 TaxID=1121022 RepID=V4R1R3_9CAUL|nr:alpha/beta fold hydrolase [Asticcacaulis benevestitus]ESQ85353.1 hypothetical protein ABENE_19065 [Asticcacaulis benevestitus DSM 16100 = ATCC BAA-896]